MRQNYEVNSELEYVGISADTTEADLKQSKTQGSAPVLETFETSEGLFDIPAVQFPSLQQGVERLSLAPVWPSRILRLSELRYKGDC